MFTCSVYIIHLVFIIGALSASASNSSVSVSKLSLPEIAVSESSVWLNCVVSSIEDVDLKWTLRRRAEDVELYRWASGGHIELHHDLDNFTEYVNHIVREKGNKGVKYHSWSVRLKATPHLSGTHSCIASTPSGKYSEHTHMLVYSPEQELCLSYEAGYDKARVKCVASKLYPQPEMMLEHNHKVIPKQELRVWLTDWFSYCAECAADVVFIEGHTPDIITCRLTLPSAGYSAIREELIPIPHKLATLLGAAAGNKTVRNLDFRLNVLLLLHILLLQYFNFPYSLNFT